MTDYLRPEAGPIPYNKHHKRARAALDKIIRALNAAVIGAQSSSDDDFVDTNRSNRIFFVSGEPGSGKSTLYLTLRKMLGKKQDSKDYSEGCRELNALNNLKKGIRWLDTLDLEVAGDEGENLLAAVLVRIIEELTNRENVSKTINSKPCEDAIKDLEELATNIGIAWEGNLQARAGALDPDTYSEEVMRTQRARLGINPRLKKALDKLAENQCFDCDENTLFVLPVDDFYLKPDASLQLLRLLRMISIPRLFFLVMGDITTVEALFLEKSLADWTKIAGPEIFTARPESKDEILGRARELRARYLRKLLPPGQRAALEVMDWNEAMKFQLKPLDSKTGGGIELRSLLATVDLDLSEDQGNPKGTFLDFLTCRRLGQSTPEDLNNVGDEKGDEKSAREAYTGLQILDATPREIMDIWIDFQKLTENRKFQNANQQNDNTLSVTSLDNNENIRDPKSTPLLILVLNFAQMVIDEQNFLSEPLQEELFNVFPTRHYYTPDTFLETDRLYIGAEASSWKDENKVELPSFKVQVRNHSQWKLMVCDPKIKITDTGNTISEDSELKEDPFAKLPPRPAAWIVLLHDLAWLWRSDSVKQNLVMQLRASVMGNSNNDRENLNSLPDFGWAIYKEETEEWKHLPFPEFQTFQELDRVLMVWNTALKWWQQDKQKGNLIDLWELSCWTVVDDNYDNFARRQIDGEVVNNWFEEKLKKLEQDVSRTLTQVSAETDSFVKSRKFNEWSREMQNLRKKLLSSPPKKTGAVKKAGRRTQ